MQQTKVSEDKMPDSFESIAVADNTSDSVKVLQNITSAGIVYFTVAHYPDDISAPGDIENLAYYRQNTQNTVREIQARAVGFAQCYAEEVLNEELNE